MGREWVAQTVQVSAAFLLIGRLLLLRLHRIYKVFCSFLIADLSGSIFWFMWSNLHTVRSHVDYRAGWFVGKVAVWILTLWTVYALVGAILTNFQGIHRFSRKMLNFSFVAALTIGLLSAIPEYSLAGTSASIYRNGLDKLVGIGVIFDRVISSTALLVLLVILLFLLWFPVEISRNLVVFSVGFLVYFAAKTTLFLGRSLASQDQTRAVSIAVTIVMTICLAYWGIFISSEGERIRTRLGHRWRPQEQERLLGQLEAINVSLLRASSRR